MSGILSWIADRFRALERAGSREHRQAAEQPLLGVGQELVAPVDGVAQRLLADGQVAAAAGEQIETALEARPDLRRREDPDPRRRQLDRQRQAVETGADLGDRRRILRGQRERGLRRPGPAARTAPPPGSRPAPRPTAAVDRSGRPQRRDVKAMLAVDVQHGAAGHEDASAPPSTRPARPAAAPRAAAARSCRARPACARESWSRTCSRSAASTEPLSMRRRPRAWASFEPTSAMSVTEPSPTK